MTHIEFLQRMEAEPPGWAQVHYYSIEGTFAGECIDEALGLPFPTSWSMVERKLRELTAEGRRHEMFAQAIYLAQQESL